MRYVKFKTILHSSILLLAVALIACPAGDGGFPSGKVPVGSTVWAYNHGGALADSGKAVAANKDGAAFVVGSFSGTAIMDGGDAILKLTSAGFTDVFIARHESDGALSWARRAGGTSDDTAMSVASMPDGGCIVAGEFRQMSMFGAGGITQVALVSAGGSDAFIARYKPDGSLAWARRAGGKSDDSALAISAFPDGSFIVAGEYAGSPAFSSPGGAEVTLPAFDGTNIFFAKYNSLGNLLWARWAAGTGDDTAHSVAALPDGTFILAGSFTESAIFGYGEPIQTTLLSSGVTMDSEPGSGSRDGFLARFNADGSLAWARAFGGVGDDAALAVSALSSGTSMVTGYFEELATFGLGQETARNVRSFGGADMFLARYDGKGALGWVARAGGIGDDMGHAVSILPDASAVAAGGFTGTATFLSASQTSQANRTAVGGEDAFLAAWSPKGALGWVNSAGGYSADRCTGLAGSSGSLYVGTGFFNGAARFPDHDPDAVPSDGEQPATKQTEDIESVEVNLTSRGQSDAFVAGFAPPVAEDETVEESAS